MLSRAIGGAAIGLGKGLLDRTGHPLLIQLEPQIPTAMDDWDEAFKEATGAYPPFSRLHLDQLALARAALRYQNPWEMAAGIQGSSVVQRRLGDVIRVRQERDFQQMLASHKVPPG